MKALSIRAGYIFDILRGTKTIEYRSWKTSYRGDLLLVSSLNPHFDSEDESIEYNCMGAVPLGYALGVIHLTDCEKVKEKSYFWHFDEVQSIVPFPVKGKLSLFSCEETVTALPNLTEAIRVWRDLGIIDSDAADLANYSGNPLSQYCAQRLKKGTVLD